MSFDQHLIEQILPVCVSAEEPPRGQQCQQWRWRWEPAELASMPDAELSGLAGQLSARRSNPAPIRLCWCRSGAVRDEPQTRHPVSIASWINNGARAARDPARYLPARQEPVDSNRPTRDTNLLNAVLYPPCVVTRPVTRTPDRKGCVDARTRTLSSAIASSASAPRLTGVQIDDSAAGYR
ncbi:hypothetical protein EV648_110288 [Kribbella sp. VKM Ac-2568]|nr:hypothetical protein EV648_110288 [Kribbella sp. VKM Ac-2568]